MTLPLEPWDHEQTCRLVDDEIRRFAELVQGADMERAVDTCPGWSLAKLIRHVGTVHRWAGTMVATAAPERLDVRSLDLGLPEHPSWLPGWLGTGGAELVERLRQADPDQEMWAWGADQHARFWPRRMLHETVVHRTDADIALDPDAHPTVDPEVAADGIDELLANLPSAAAFSPGIRDLKGEGAFALETTDSKARWFVQLHADGFTASRVEVSDPPAEDAVVMGTGAGLLLLLYRRLAFGEAEADVTGDRSVVDRFLAHAAIE